MNDNYRHKCPSPCHYMRVNKRQNQRSKTDRSLQYLSNSVPSVGQLENEGHGVDIESILPLVKHVSKHPRSNQHLTRISATSSVLLSGLAYSARGVIGLGRNQVGVVEQLSHTFGFSEKFLLLHNDMILFGETTIEVSESMIYTPILMGNNNNGDSYHTISPYILVKSKIYKAIVNAFAMKAEMMKMSRLNPVGQFEVPVIDLIMQSKMVKWRIYEHNSMVKVNYKVMCLRILDGGDELKASNVLGTHQLEDHLFNFDFGTLMIGFNGKVTVLATLVTDENN
ncbi:hypothetical protein RND81_02G239200 [Saponaria officinalis]|uniref:Xylanase inhibitor C-terminal domain-containing protein n=1 Tax=Saponaria officinalis TaxID=3572 RepID=A0AAW1MWQ1_SAPOF